MENKKDRETDAGKAGGVIPAEFFSEIGHGEDGENSERDNFLNCFELGGGEFIRANAIGRDLEAIFEKSNSPTGENDFPESFAAVFEVTVPGEGHKDVGHGEKKNGAHEETRPRFEEFRCTVILCVSDARREASRQNLFERNFREWQLAIPHTNGVFSRVIA
jgi:hypothetical protein